MSARVVSGEAMKFANATGPGGVALADDALFAARLGTARTSYN